MAHPLRPTVLLASLVVACVAPAGTPGPTATAFAVPSAPSPTASIVPATPSAPPSLTVTCVPMPTPENPEPSHAPVNGQPRLDEPWRVGVILVQIRQCRDIAEVLSRYGLAGPATRYDPDVSSPESATRWFLVTVPPGTESATVVSLYTHPDDVEYVQLIPQFRGGVSTPPPK